MKNNHIIRTTLCVLAALASACSSDEIADPKSDDMQITMTASDFKRADGSRTSIDVTPSGGEFNWAENDTVGIFPDRGAQAYFPMTNGAGTKTAVFDGGGWALKPSSTYAAYYPFDCKMYLEKSDIPVNFEGQVQVGNGSTAHLGKFDYMGAVETTPANGMVNFEFQHLCALVELTIPVPKKGNVSIVTLSTEEQVFVRRGCISFFTSSVQISNTDFSNSVFVDLKDVSTTADHESVKVYFMLAPVDLTNKPIRATIVNNGEEFHGVVESKNFEAGKIYALTVSLEGQDPKPIQNEYHVATAGTLRDLIGEENKLKVKELKLTGELNGTDIRFIREMAGRDIDNNFTNGLLTSLDLSDAKIVEGGDYYFYDDYFNDYFRTRNNEISDYMFSDCIFTNIKLPTGVDLIGRRAFSGCARMTDVSIPEGVTDIASYAFSNCIGLTNLKIPSSVYRISEHAFEYCKFLTNFTIPEGVTSIANYCFDGCFSLVNVTIPEGVTTIGRYAFQNCHALASIKLPSTVDFICSYAFAACSQLKSITIPEGVRSVDYRTFSNCIELTNVNLPSSVTMIDEYAFEYCGSLKRITLPNELGSIRSYAFSACGLTSITIPKSVTSIGIYTFHSCHSLTTIRVEKGMEWLKENYFISAQSCEEIYLPSTLTSIMNHALPENLKAIYCFAVEAPELYPENLKNQDFKIYVPKGSVDKYKVADGWKNHAARIFDMPKDVVEP